MVQPFTRCPCWVAHGLRAFSCATLPLSLTLDRSANMSLPGQSKLECADVVEGTAAQLVQMIIDSIKSGKKKVMTGMPQHASWTRVIVAPSNNDHAQF
jgi:hypothetical protein